MQEELGAVLWSGSACSWLLQQLWCSASKLGWSTSSEAPNIGQLLDSSTPSTTRTSTTGPPLRPSLRVTLSVSCDRLPLFRSFLELRERERERESSVRREIGVTELTEEARDVTGISSTSCRDWNLIDQKTFVLQCSDSPQVITR